MHARHRHRRRLLRLAFHLLLLPLPALPTSALALHHRRRHRRKRRRHGVDPVVLDVIAVVVLPPRIHVDKYILLVPPCPFPQRHPAPSIPRSDRSASWSAAA
ncbi:hypothetical protein C8J57DRAFT_1333280 [Mycena rebaudengoi]|nr:hypothetical protein C8J57DRAFT_1333280 [Mycena rebaudengoi]